MKNWENPFRSDGMICWHPFNAIIVRSVFIGILTSAITGLIAGSCVGMFNETIVPDDDNEELHLGFAEYTMYGMGFFGAILSAFVGAAGSLTAAFAGAISKKPLFGIIFGICGTVFFMIFIGLISRPWLISDWKQESLVWTLGGITGASISGYLSAKK